MKTNIISNVVSLKEKPFFLRFSLTFIAKSGEHEEYIFFDSTIAQCVIKSIGFINFMLRVRGMKVVYIFPVNSSSFYHSVYRCADGENGRYKIVKCDPEFQLDIFTVMKLWQED